MDRDCYRQVLRDDPDLIPDYMKDYPCLDVDHTEIKAWKADGRWRPYAEATPDARDLKEVLIYRQQITPPWVRVNRIQRDFREARPGCLGYTSVGVKTNLAQIVKAEAEARDIYCQCIRCSEIRGESFDPAEIRYERHAFTASGAPEWFLAAVVPRPNRNLLLGFLRLRISPALHDTTVIPELRGRTAMIRELHVYGPVTRVGTASRGAQHLGIGFRLLHMAQWIAAANGARQIAVISGVGVRGYYARHGFTLCGTYMIRPLWRFMMPTIIALSLLFLTLSAFIYHYITRGR
jgi:elongator complex protein 3